MHRCADIGRVVIQKMLHGIGILAALAILSSLPVQSISAQGGDNKHLRQGFWISVGAGGGTLGCDDCGDRESGGTGQIALGGTFSQRFQLGASANAWTKEVNGVTVTMGSVTALAKFYPSRTNGFFLSGGLGVGNIEFSEGSVSISQDGTAAILGIGYDFRVSRNFSITPFANGVGASFDGNGANFNQLGIALTWH